MRSLSISMTKKYKNPISEWLTENLYEAVKNVGILGVICPYTF